MLEQEAEDRRHRRINRLRRESRLPVGKTWETFEHGRMPLALRQRLDHLAQGDFVGRGVNVLAFGLPGTGKTHALCALGHRLVEAGHSVLFAPAYRLVQELLAAKRDLDLPRQLRKLDNFDFLLLDDLGYLPQGAEESEVLFTLIAERYERRSLGITSNLVFSEWEHTIAKSGDSSIQEDNGVHWTEGTAFGSQGHGQPGWKPSFQAQGVQSGVDQGGEYFAQPRTAYRMDVFIPAAVLHVMLAVLNAPVVAELPQQLSRAALPGTQASQQIPALPGHLPGG